MSRTYVLGTRNSALAMWQAEFVQWLLEEQWPDDQFNILGMKTSGDDKSLKLSEAGGKGLYIKEVEEALLREEVDVCVHSLKDLPVEMPEGCSLAAILERGEVRDVLISKDKLPFSEFKEGMKIGTSSLRRKALLNAQSTKAEIVDVRGNIETRIQKVMDGEIDGVVLAAAGVLRLGLENLITEYFEPSVFVPAPGQGAIALECRANDDELRLKLRRIHDDESGQAVSAERTFLSVLGGSCTLPLGAWCEIEQFQMRLVGFLGDPDGGKVMMESAVGPIGHGEELGEKLAERFKSQGASRILEGLA